MCFKTKQCVYIAQNRKYKNVCSKQGPSFVPDSPILPPAGHQYVLHFMYVSGTILEHAKRHRCREYIVIFYLVIFQI